MRYAIWVGVFAAVLLAIVGAVFVVTSEPMTDNATSMGSNSSEEIVLGPEYLSSDYRKLSGGRYGENGGRADDRLMGHQSEPNSEPNEAPIPSDVDDLGAEKNKLGAQDPSDQEPNLDELRGEEEAHFLELESRFEIATDDAGFSKDFGARFFHDFRESGIGSEVDVEWLDCKAGHCVAVFGYPDHPGISMKKVFEWLAEKQPCEFHMPGPKQMEVDSKGGYHQRVHIICTR
ncbi:MAG: hypothetical protein JRF33_09540 [Deltaproteobacteria bacterium]|nr:hypothetical protein [Deltaproteobacteria bacterium]